CDSDEYCRKQQPCINYSGGNLSLIFCARWALDGTCWTYLTESTAAAPPLPVATAAVN
ncbi:hypothetical protein ACJ72_08841, partial [Emergomyces africanus]